MTQDHYFDGAGVVDPIAHERGGPECVAFGMHGHGTQGTPDYQLYRSGQPVTYRHEFEWRWPTATIVRPATRRPFRVVLNRYPGVIIGVAVQIGAHALSVLWGRPGRVMYAVVSVGGPGEQTGGQPWAT